MNSLILRYRWTHSEVELNGREYNEMRGPMISPFSRGNVPGELGDVKYAYGYLDIDQPHEKTDGIYTVTVSHLGEEQFRAHFRIENCENEPE